MRSIPHPQLSNIPRSRKALVCFPLKFETIIHRANGEVEVYEQTGDTPQSLAVIRERLQQHPEGIEELFQRGDGFLYDTP